MKAPHACPLDSPSRKASGNRPLHEQFPRDDNSSPARAPASIRPHPGRHPEDQKSAETGGGAVFGLANWLANGENRKTKVLS